ncbi:MAG: hypothetical protein QHH09_02620 [Microgenomates group bacterium]|nr:hypothetical protein [Microgenomates group bacterium]
MTGQSAAELIPSSPETISLAETACGLKRQQDAVFDGQNLAVGFLKKGDDGKDLTEDERKQKAESLAQKLTGLKDASGKSFFGDKGITAEEIVNLPQAIQKLIQEKKIAGVLVNILGEEKGGETSALAMVTLLKFIKDNPEAPLDQAFTRVLEVLKAARVKDEDLQKLSLAAVVIGKDGQASTIVTGDQQVKVFGEEDKTFDSQIEKVDDGKGGKVIKPKVQTFKSKKGDKIILCDKVKAQSVDKTKSIGEIINSIVSSESDPSAAGGGTSVEEPKKNGSVESLEEVADLEGVIHKPPYYKDTDTGVSIEDFSKKHSLEYEQAEQLVNQAKTKIQRKKDETDFDYQCRVIDEVEKRLRYNGDYLEGNDEIYQLIIQLKPPSQDLVLMGIEALKVNLLREENKRRLASYSLPDFRRAVKTEVSHIGSPAFVEGNYEQIFITTPEGKKEKISVAKKDLYAFTLVADRLLDIKETGEFTYRQQMQMLEKIINDSKSSQKDRDEASRQLVDLRRRFYQTAIEAIRYLDHQGRYQGSEPQVEMIKILRKIRQEQDISSLIEAYQGVMVGLSERHKKEMSRLLSQDPQNLLDYALKGADLMDRRISYAPELLEVPDKIFYKKFVQKTGRDSKKDSEPLSVGKPGGESGEVEEDDLTHPYTPQHEALKRVIRPGGKELDDSGLGELSPAPVRKEGEPTGTEDNPPPAPVPGKRREPSGQPPPPEAEFPATFNFAIVSDEQRVNQEVGALARHYRASDKPALGWKILLHPRAFIRNFWKNTIFSSWFDDQANRFSMGLTEAARRRLGIDSSVPIELSPELMDQALEEAKRLKKQQSLGRKIGFFFRNIGAKVFGISQTSEMVLAREWLETQAPAEIITNITSHGLKDQTDFAQRFALEETAGLKPISEEIGEQRFLLEQSGVDQQVVAGFKGKIKELALAVCQGQMTKEVALKTLNEYFRGQVYDKLSPEVKKALEGIELSSNLLGLVDFLQQKDQSGKAYWQLYQERKGEDPQKTKWDELDFKIYLGKGRYEAARGDIELTGLQRKLIRRMMERNYRKETGFQFSNLPRAVELLKDIGYFGGSYIFGGLAGGFRFGRSFAMRFVGFNPATGTLAMTLAAGLREGPAVARKGRLKGIAGRVWQDFVQVSRESGQGRGSAENAVLRKQFEALLVDQRSATELTKEITDLLAKENLSAEEQQRLLLAIAHAQARMRTTDLSTRRGKRVLGVGDIEVPQNFISYDFDKRNEQLTALRSAILDGAAKLSQANPELLSKLAQAQAVFEAQLRIGSTKEKLVNVLVQQNGLSQDEAQKIVNEFFVDLGITKDKSLEGSARRLAGLTWKRTGQMLGMSVVAGLGGKILIGEASNLIHDIGQAGGILHFGEGIREYLGDWGEVFHGDVPIEVDRGGHFIADLSPLQRGVIQAPYLAHNLGIDRLLHLQFPPAETVNLGGNTQVQMPTGYHFQQADFNHDGITDTVLVNKAVGGEVVFGVSGYHLGAVDIDGDGSLNLVLQDSNGQVLIDASNGRSILEEMLASKGINISLTERVIGSHTISQTETIFTTPSTFHTETIGNLNIQTPDGTHWVDNHNGTYDLVENKTGMTLIDDAQVDHGNLIIDPNTVHSSLHHNINYQGAGEQIVSGDQARADWEKILRPSPERQVWWTNATRGSDYQELRLYNEVYRDANGNLGVHFIGPTGQGSIDGVHFQPVEQVADANGGMQLGIFVKGLGHLRIDMNSDGMGSSHDLWLDTTNNSEVLSNGAPIVMPDGHHLTVAELAKMLINQDKLNDHLQQAGISVGSQPVSLASEYRGWLDVFNIGDNGRTGYFVAGFTSPEGVFNHLATISGTGDLTTIVGEPREAILELTGSITRTVQEVVEDKVKTFVLEAPPTPFSLPSLWFIPVRENIEKSVVKTKPSSSTTSQPTDSRQPSSKPVTALTAEQKQKKQELERTVQQQEQRLAEILGLPDKQKKKQSINEIARQLGRKPKEVEQALEDKEKIKELARDLALRQAAEASLTDEEKNKESEEREKIIRERMEEMRRILETEAEAQEDLSIPTEPEIKADYKKEDYERDKEQVVEFLTGGKLEKINQLLENLGLPKLSENELNELRADKQKLEQKAREIILVNIRRNLEMQIIIKIQEEEVAKLQGDDKETYTEYINVYTRILETQAQIDELSNKINELSDNDPNEKTHLERQRTQSQELQAQLTTFKYLTEEDQKTKALLNKLNQQVEKRFNEEYKQKVEAEMERIRKEIEE